MPKLRDVKSGDELPMEEEDALIGRITSEVGQTILAAYKARGRFDAELELLAWAINDLLGISVVFKSIESDYVLVDTTLKPESR